MSDELAHSGNASAPDSSSHLVPNASDGFSSPTPVKVDASASEEGKALASSSTSLADPLINSLLTQRYTIQRRLARGGMATVYIAHDERLDRQVAIKVMHPHLAENQQFIARFDREARSAARITHPAVVSVTDQGAIDGRPFLVMDLIDGPNLRELLRSQGAFSLRQTLDYTRDILQALRAAAREGVIHRDIKPENVMIPADGPARVTDFGLAKAVSEATMSATSNMLGTVTYMAPEIATTGKADARTDLYSLGIMVFEMLTGAVPWHGDNALHIAYSHVHDDVPSPSSEQSWIPREVDDFVAALTARQPDERPSTAAEALVLLDRLTAVLPAELLDARAEVAASGEGVKTHILPGAAQAVAPTAFLPPIYADKVASSEDVTVREVDPAGEDKSAHILLQGQATHPSVMPDSTVPDSAGPDSMLPDSAVPDSSASGALPLDEDATASFPALPREDADSTITTSVAPLSSRDTDLNVIEKQTGSQVKGTVKAVTLPPTQRPKRRRLLLILAMVFSLLLVSGAGGTWWWFEFGPGAYIELPATDSRPATEVRAELEKLGFSVIENQEFSDDVPTGKVISSVPASATSAHKDSIITLIVSKGVDLRAVPNIIAKTREEAQTLITDAGLSVGAVEEVWSEEIPAGQVISQVQDPSSHLRAGSNIDFTVSKGREPRNVPELVGKTKDQVTATLSELALNAEYTEAFSDEVPAGTIISQETAAGTQLFRGDKVQLTISKGPEMAAVPEISGMSRQEAVNALEAAGFQVEVNYLLGGIFGTAHSTDPKSGTMLKKGSTVTLTVV